MRPTFVRVFSTIVWLVATGICFTCATHGEDVNTDGMKAIALPVGQVYAFRERVRRE
jgi:hypothetical protein